MLTVLNQGGAGLSGSSQVKHLSTRLSGIIRDYLDNQSEDLRYLSLNFFIRKKTSSQRSETRADPVTRNQILQNWE